MPETIPEDAPASTEIYSKKLMQQQRQELMEIRTMVYDTNKNTNKEIIRWGNKILELKAMRTK